LTPKKKIEEKRSQRLYQKKARVFFAWRKLMATLRELIIKISANSQSFQTEISRASRMGQDYYRTMQNGGRQAPLPPRERKGVI
jgi:hypothetical protein